MATTKNVPMPEPDDEEAPAEAPVEAPMKMTPSEFAELRANAAKITQQDFHLGNFLTNLLHHLAHAHGLDAATEDAKAAAQEGETNAN